MARIYPSRNVKGVYYINGKPTSLSNFRLCRYKDLNEEEIESFNKYRKDYKL